MKKFLRVLSVLGLVLAGLGCSSDIIDDTKFKLYYYNALLTVGDDFIANPSYIGPAPHSFEITGVTYNKQIYYNPKLDGALHEKSHFYINYDTGTFFVNQTADMKTGTYLVSIKCVSDGVQYTYPDMIIVKLNKAQVE